MAVYRQAVGEWLTARVDADCLGDESAEMSQIADDWRRTGQRCSLTEIRPPVLVVSDPRHRFGYGCSTNSHWTPGDRRALETHADCAHGSVMDHIVAGMREGARRR